MKIIGVAGASGAGKNTFAGLLAAELVHLGYRVSLDSFAAPIKWHCRAAGWKGEKTSAWRRIMQSIGDAIHTTLWMSDKRVAFWGFPRDECWRGEMERLEQHAIDNSQDKMVYWLGRRNGISFISGSGWHESCTDNPFSLRFEGRADFLIVTDVRRDVEAAFCRANGVLLFLEGTHAPLADTEAAHSSEQTVASLRDTADYIVSKQDGLERMAAAVRTIVALQRHVKRA